jgi:glycosyltransferase involved in cell wall biosynthesis
MSVDGRVPRDIVFAALVEWGRTPYWRWRSLFRAATAAGHRVLWADEFDEFQSRRDLAKDPRRLLRRLRQTDEGIFLLSSPLRVRRGDSLAARIVSRLAVGEVREAIDRLHFTDPLLWIAGPKGQRLIGRIKERVVVYDSADDLQRLGAAPAMVVEESLTIQRSNLVIAVSKALGRTPERLGVPVAVVPNGVDPQHFLAATEPGPAPSSLAGLSRPVLGYYGNIYERMDWELVGTVATRLAEWSIVFVGAIGAEPPPYIRALRNVVFLGEIPFEELPMYYRAFDVCWVPHRVNDLTIRQSSLKTYEYLAAGRPTVVTPVPMGADVRSVVSVAGDTESVVAAVTRELMENDAQRTAARIDVARANSWTVRFAEMRAAIDGVLR